MSNGSNSLSADLLVREYLQSRGLTKTLEALESECTTLSSVPADSTKAALVSSYLPVNSQDLLFLTMNNADGTQYTREYRVFSRWVGASLDLVKPYLQALSFILFVHSYITLVRRDLTEQARIFLSEFKETVSFTFTEELEHLALLQTKSQLGNASFLSSNPFLKATTTSKFCVSLTHLAFTLLAAFLDENELILLAAIINESVDVDMVANESHHEEIVDVSALLQLPEYTLSRSKVWNNTKLVLGVPGSGKQLSNAQKVSPLFNNVQQIDRQNSLYKTWLDKLVRPRALLRRAGKKVQRIEAHGHAGSSNADKHEKCNQDIKFNLQVGMQVLKSAPAAEEDGSRGNIDEPSVIFSTIGNAHDNLICMDIHPNLTQIASGYSDGIVRIWRLDRGSTANNVPSFGQSLATTGFRNSLTETFPKPKVCFTDEYQDLQAMTQQELRKQTIQAEQDSIFPLLELKGHSKPVYSVSQDSTERLVLSSSADETIRLWDLAVVQCVAKYECLSPAWDVQFSPLDYYFAAGNSDHTVTLYAMDRPTPIRMLTGHSSDVNKVAWHGNGSLIASGGDDKTVRLWDIRTPECVRVLQGCASPVSSLSISGLGNLLVAGTEVGNIYLYELTTSKLLAILYGHQEPVYSLSFSSDGLHVVSGARDCSMRVWDTLPAFEGLDKTGQSDLTKGQVILRPKLSFFTKDSPVYTVGCTSSDLLYAGGPCPALAHEGMGVWAAQQKGSQSEQEVAQRLGLSTAVPSHV